MKIKIIYPTAAKRKVQRREVIRAARFPFLFAALIMVVINWATGGPAWCVIGLWSLWLVWSFLIAPDLVERNRISLWIRFITGSSIMLRIIDTLFPVGWSVEVVPIVVFCGLAVAAALFFTDLPRQSQNMLPMLILIAVSLFSSITGLLVVDYESRWALAVLGAIAGFLLVACVIVMGKGFIREVKKRFHVR